MFNNRRFPSSSLSYSYFGKKYHNDDTFTLAIGLIILSLWHLIYVSSNWKFRSLFLSDLVGICNKFLRKILYLTLFPLRKEGTGWKLPSPFSTQTFWKISESINWCGLCFCDFQFISIWHILRNLQGSAALRSPAVAILLKVPEDFRKFIILYKFHIFCILAALQYFDEKITFDDKVI